MEMNVSEIRKYLYEKGIQSDFARMMSEMIMHTFDYDKVHMISGIVTEHSFIDMFCYVFRNIEAEELHEIYALDRERKMNYEQLLGLMNRIRKGDMS